MGENLAFTARAIREAQRWSPKEPRLLPVIEYLIDVGRLFIGPGDMWWVNVPNENPQVFVPLVPVEQKP